jgi:hypothetical protein
MPGSKDGLPVLLVLYFSTCQFGPPWVAPCLINCIFQP